MGEQELIEGLRALAEKAGFTGLDEVELFDLAFDWCSLCCNDCQGGNC